MAILFCFAACKNSSSDSGDDEPKIISTYELDGDTIKLYDNNTFVITLKNNAGEISGTYLYRESVYELKVDNASDDVAKSDDTLKLKVADGKIRVVSSNITRYPAKNDEEDSDTTPDDNQNTNTDIDYSLGDAPDESTKTDKFSIEENSGGVYLTFDVPKDTWQTKVYIDGIGDVAEQVWYNEDKTKGDFFFPFVEAGKEYTIRLIFLRDEDKDSDGFVIDYVDDDGTIGWFETKVKAGAKSKGEVRIKDFGKVKIETNGDFKFTERLTLKNENLLPEDWSINIGLVEGISWMHEGRKTKWNAATTIPQKKLTETTNLYTDTDGSWKSGDFSKIDFICYRPVLQYEYDGKKYNYQWYSKCVNTPQLNTIDIDISNTADVAKIKGTWVIKEEWDKGSFHNIDTQTMDINDTTIKQITSYAKTKLDGSAFTIDELLRWCYLEEQTVSFSESEEFESKLKNDTNVLKFEQIDKDSESFTYKIYKLDSDYTVSSDKKTVTEKYEFELNLSEILAGHIGENYTKNYHFKLSEDGSILLIIASTKYSEGGSYAETAVYTKQ